MLRPIWELQRFENQVKHTSNTELIEEYFYMLGYCSALDSCGVYELKDTELVRAIEKLLKELEQLPI